MNQTKNLTTDQIYEMNKSGNLKASQIFHFNYQRRIINIIMFRQVAYKMQLCDEIHRIYLNRIVYKELKTLEELRNERDIRLGRERYIIYITETGCCRRNKYCDDLAIIIDTKRTITVCPFRSFERRISKDNYHLLVDPLNNFINRCNKDINDLKTVQRNYCPILFEGIFGYDLLSETYKYIISCFTNNISKKCYDVIEPSNFFYFDE